MTNGIELIAAERARQMVVEGWTADHDDKHEHGEMAHAAACYAVGEPVFVQNRYYLYDDMRLTEVSFLNLWPWGAEWYKPNDRISDLVRAGALIAAEIDRLLREQGGTGS